MFKLVALSGLGLASAQLAGDITRLCTGLQTKCGWSAWANQTTCEAMFANTPNGTDDQTNVDTVGCREHYLNNVSAATDPQCLFASASGGGVCGKPADGACRAITQLCPTQFTNLAACTSSLGALPLGAIPGWKTGAVSGGEHSLECRVYHATASLSDVNGPSFHCGHTVLASTQCTAGVMSNADAHCAQLEATCTGTNLQYVNAASCKASFSTFPQSVVNGTNTNDQGSRQYHGVAATVDPTGGHCQHAGPSGGGAVGDVYMSWVKLTGGAQCAAAAPMLGATVGIALSAWAPADLMAVIPPGAANTYTANAGGPTGNTAICRIYHLSVGLTGGANLFHCAHGDLFGGQGQCGDFLDNLCGLIQRACGVQAYADANACKAAIGALIAANKTGTPGDMAPNDDSVACRAYNGGIALANKANASMAMAVTASCNKIKMIGGCGGNATGMVPTMAPSSAATLGLSAVLMLLPLAY